MKSKVKILSLLPLALALAPLASLASDNFENGNLAVVFYPVTGTAPTVLGPQYFVFNLGPASLYRENMTNDVPVSTVNPLIGSSNIATDLAAVFGPTWASDGIVRMFVTSTIPFGTTNLVNGDPAITIYGSVPRTSLNNGQTGSTGLTFPAYNFSSLRNSSSGKVRPFIYDGINPAIAQTGGYTNSNPTVAPFGNAAGVRLPMSGNLIGLNLYVPPATSTYFDVGTNPSAIFGTGTLAGTAGVEGAVAMYRVLHSLTDGVGAPADLTSGSSAGNAAIGVPQYIGSLSLSTAGVLRVQAAGVAPTNSYTTWAAAFTLPPLSDTTRTGDPDFDGLTNVVEYALGLDPRYSSVPAGVFSANKISYTKGSQAITNGDVSWTIETSETLAGGSWTNTVVQAAGNSTPTIEFTFTPGTPAKKFARLKVISTP